MVGRVDRDVDAERLQLLLDDLRELRHFCTPPAISSGALKPCGYFDLASSAFAAATLYSSTGVFAE